MTAYNVVRFRVKPGKDKEFIAAQKIDKPMKGFRKGGVIKTGDRTYCFIGEWGAMSDIVAARPQMIGMLDKVRPLLDDLGSGLGLTDPVSGETVVDLP